MVSRRKCTAVGPVGNQVLKRSRREGEDGGTTKNGTKDTLTGLSGLSVCLPPLFGLIWHL